MFNKKLASFWRGNCPVEDGLTLPNDLKSVFLTVIPEDSYSGFIHLEYYFNNNDAAEDEISALKDDAL